MDILGHIVEKYHIDLKSISPIEIPRMRRVDLAALFAELQFTVGAEIGVEQGIFSEVLCQQNPGLHLYCIDPWTTYPGYHDYLERDAEVMEARHQEALARLKPYSATVIEKFSMDALVTIPDESLDFIYIDANHEVPWILDDIYWWSKKVKKGGIISGHDFYKSVKTRQSKCHVWYAVMCYTQAKGIAPWFLCGLKGEPVDAPPPAINRDRERSWFWVKDR